MGENTHSSCQLCTRPLPVIEPYIRKTTNIRHDVQAEVDDKASNSARNQFLFQVSECCKDIIQIRPTIVIENANESNMRSWSDISNESSHKNTMVRHVIITRLIIEITPSTYITDDRIAIILNLQRTILATQIRCETLHESVTLKFGAHSGAHQAIWMLRGIEYCNHYVFCIVGVKRQTCIDKGDMPTNR